MSMCAEASLVIAVFAASPVAAGCICACQDGCAQPVCDSVADVPPVCAPRACAIEPPAVRPLPGPAVRPLGTASCALTRVHDEATGNFEWVRLCN